MPVALTVSNTLNGSNFSDSLVGGSTGANLGESQTSDPSPPAKTIYLRHNGTFAITNLAVHLAPFTGTYGGDYSASADHAKALDHGDLNQGLQIDFRWNAAIPFSVITQTKSGVGASFATRITVPIAAMSLNNSGTEVAAISPTPGKVGSSGDSIAGDRAHFAIRYVTPISETQVGQRQLSLISSYNFQS